MNPEESRAKVFTLILAQETATGMVPDPSWVACELGVRRAAVCRIYRWLERDGHLLRTRGAWSLAGRSEQ